MSIPLDRLYQHINDMAKQICSKPINLYRFYPHGSKKIENLTALTELTQEEFFTSPEIYCNDQEPLNYDLYATGPAMHLPPAEVDQALKRKGIEFPRLNFRGNVISIWDQAILLHSEKRSADLEQYQTTQFIPVYYWNHAVLALDWFRYAQHIEQHKQVSKTFLIYNRAWAGTREYRLRFAELLVQLDLQDNCMTSINAVEPETGIHYKSHKFKNSTWRPNTVLENFFTNNTAQSHYSADFVIEDYESTDIEVVLETLFDDTRLHLTEKILRPIACGHPFVLAGTHGSLEYLRSYGFQTFGDVWNEEYDLIENPQQRLRHIVDLMRQIANWTPQICKDKLAQAQAVADHNRQHFFSKNFFNLVYNELHTNLTSALTQLENNNTASDYLHLRTVFNSDPELYQLVKDFKKDETRKKMLELAQWYNNRNSNLHKNK
jgi:hypothetical protein